MKNSIRFLIPAILIFVIGCHTENEKVSMETTEQTSVATTSIKNFEQNERKLLKEGRVKFETESIDASRKKVFQAVEIHQGYVSSDQENNIPGRISNTMVIRMPSENFDNFLRDATSGVKKFESKDISVKDVTEEFLDIQARLKTKKELEKRYLSLLNQAHTIAEILEIEKHIDKLRPEIESIEGRLKYLEDRISLSTLTMTFYETLLIETEFGQKFTNGLKNGWDSLIWFLVILANIWPFLFIGLGIIVGIRLYKKRR